MVGVQQVLIEDGHEVIVKVEGTEVVKAKRSGGWLYLWSAELIYYDLGVGCVITWVMLLGNQIGVSCREL